MSDSSNIQEIHNAIFDVGNGMQSRLERVEANTDAIDVALTAISVGMYQILVVVNATKNILGGVATNVAKIKTKVGA